MIGLFFSKVTACPKWVKQTTRKVKQMKNQETQATKHQKPQRQPYEPPKAAFVPLQPQERLMQGSALGFMCCTSWYSMS
jgi:hypothetical protein